MLTTVDSDLDFENGEWRSYPENIGPAGTQVTLTVLRGGTARPLSFALAPFL
jgi:hypothetical protein